MTLILCDTHGPSHFFESCEHIHDILLEGLSTKIHKIRFLCYTMDICEACLNKHQLDKYILEENPDHNKQRTPEPENFWNKFEMEYDKMKNRKGWCVHCYEELRNE